MFKNIVVAISSTNDCNHAIQAGINLARSNQASLTIFHSCGLREHSWGDIRHLIPSGLTQQVKKEIKTNLGKILAACPEAKIKVSVGLAHDEILRFLRSEKADLIIMGPHSDQSTTDVNPKYWGRPGTTLHKIGLKAKCPLMIVSRPWHPDFLNFKHITVGTDFSPPSKLAFHFSLKLQKHFNARVSFFHGVRLGIHEPPEEEIEHQLNSAVEKMAEEYKPYLQNENYEFLSLEGNPHRELLKTARSKKSSAIILAHHSREKVGQEPCMGSTLVNVALRSFCPVISIGREEALLKMA